jgi:hypothetical protein
MAAAAAVRSVPGDYTTIQEAINACNNGDIVIIAAGRYTGSGNRDIDFLGKAITVSSINPEDPCVIAATIIDCNGTEENPHRGFHFHSGEGANSVLNGVTIINGCVTHDLGSAGGAICCENGSSPKIINCIITGNKATSWPWIGSGSGGAVFGCNGEISNCLISENLATFSGGGLSLCAGIVRNNIITNNKSAYVGGGLFGCNGIIQNNVISGNSAVGYGGGLAYCNGNISNCIIWSNQIHDSATVRYSDVQGGWPGEGNIDADPRFADPGSGDYHLKSTAGRWNPNSESWVTDAVTSPCIDAGNPGCPLGDEPSNANNVRINMGAYGGTAEASKTPADWRSIADLTNNWVVDFNDLGVFVSYWLDSGECIPSELNRNRTVNFVDYTIFAQQWLDTTAEPIAEPGIEYQISPCGGRGLSATEQLDETRFTVTVEGRYIHLEDMMVANCCPKELWLEMTVEDNLITVCENEWGGVCFCICNYPVTATLGPFEPGTYTLEVYNGGFIGSTTVIIE